jgi:hypothetical protein
MHRTWAAVCGLGAVLLVLTTGCQSNKPLIKRPELVEEYVMPPDDPRFKDPHFMYAKNTLNQYSVKPDSPVTPAGGMRMPGMSPSMGPQPGR